MTLTNYRKTFKQSIKHLSHIMNLYFITIMSCQKLLKKKKMDACVTLRREICALISNRLETVEDYNDQLEKERVRGILNKGEYGSIFGHAITETVKSERLSNHSSSNNTSSSKADAAKPVHKSHERN